MGGEGDAASVGGHDSERRALWPGRDDGEPRDCTRVLDASLMFSATLPCRIALYEEDGNTRLAAFKPTALAAGYPAEMRDGIEELEAVLVDAIDEAIAEP